MAAEGADLTDVIRAMHEAVDRVSTLQVSGEGPREERIRGLLGAEMMEHYAGRALLVALEGVPERLALVGGLEAAAQALAESCTWGVDPDGVSHDSYSDDARDNVLHALAALRKGES